MIYILYATKVNIGGWATFTRHLFDSLVAEGQEATIVKIGNRTEEFMRPFGDQGHQYQNVAEADLIRWAKGDPMIIAALGKHYVETAEKLIAKGAKVVIHDTAESTNRMDVGEAWVIRKALRRAAPRTRFIRHPYVPHERPVEAQRRAVKAVATSRVDFDKNTAMILDANRLGANINIVGFENRLYTRFKIMPDYPEWVQSPGTHPKTGAGSYAHCLTAKFMVDLTDIKGDGGGTQYTFLEAWDAGAVPIIGEWWIREKDDMKVAENCWAIRDAHDLLSTLRSSGAIATREEMAAMGRRRLLKKHAPAIIVPEVIDWLGA